MRHAAPRQVLANPKCEQGTRARGGQKATRKQAHEQARAAGPLGQVDKARRKAGRANLNCLLTNEELNSIFQKSISAEKKKMIRGRGKHTYCIYMHQISTSQNSSKVEKILLLTWKNKQWLLNKSITAWIKVMSHIKTSIYQMNLMLVFRNTAVNLRNSNNHQHRMHEKLKYNTLHRVLHQSSFTRYRRGLNCF